MASEYLPEFNAMPMANSTDPKDAKTVEQIGNNISEFSQLIYRKVKGVISLIKKIMIINELNHDLIHCFCAVQKIYQYLLTLRKDLNEAFFTELEVLFIVYPSIGFDILNEIKKSPIDATNKTLLYEMVIDDILSEVYESKFTRPTGYTVISSDQNEYDNSLLDDITLDEEVVKNFKRYNGELKELLAKNKGSSAAGSGTAGSITAGSGTAGSGTAEAKGAAEVEAEAEAEAEVEAEAEAEAEEGVKAEVEKYKADVNKMTPEQRATELDRINRDENGKKRLELVIARGYISPLQNPLNAGRPEPSEEDKDAAEAANKKLDLAIKKQNIIEEAVQADIDELARRTKKIEVKKTPLEVITNNDNTIIYIRSTSLLKDKVTIGEKITAVNNIPVNTKEDLDSKLEKIMTDYNSSESKVLRHHTITVVKSKETITDDQKNNYKKEAFTRCKQIFDEYKAQLPKIKDKAFEAKNKAYIKKDTAEKKVYEDELNIYKGMAQDVLDTMDKGANELKGELDGIQKYTVDSFKAEINRLWSEQYGKTSDVTSAVTSDVTSAASLPAAPPPAAPPPAAPPSADASPPAAAALAPHLRPTHSTKPFSLTSAEITQRAAAAAAEAEAAAKGAAVLAEADAQDPTSPSSDATKNATEATNKRRTTVEAELKTKNGKAYDGKIKDGDKEINLDSIDKTYVKDANDAIDRIINSELAAYEAKYKESYDKAPRIKPMFRNERSPTKNEAAKYANEEATKAGIAARLEEINKRITEVEKKIALNKNSIQDKKISIQDKKKLRIINGFLRTDEIGNLETIKQKADSPSVKKSFFSSKGGSRKKRNSAPKKRTRKQRN